MRVAVVGGGPAGLYFSLLLKKARPDTEINLFERNAAGATYGWGVVFSDRSLTSFREADYKTYTQITDDFIIWDAIDVRYRDQVIRCGGQVFSGIERKTLLAILAGRCTELGVELEYERNAERYQVLRYDTRGHGGTDAPQGPYTLEQMADDAHAMLAASRRNPACIAQIAASECHRTGIARETTSISLLSRSFRRSV